MRLTVLVRLTMPASVWSMFFVHVFMVCSFLCDPNWACAVVWLGSRDVPMWGRGVGYREPHVAPLGMPSVCRTSLGVLTPQHVGWQAEHVSWHVGDHVGGVLWLVRALAAAFDTFMPSEPLKASRRSDDQVRAFLVTYRLPPALEHEESFGLL